MINHPVLLLRTQMRAAISSCVSGAENISEWRQILVKCFCSALWSSIPRRVSQFVPIHYTLFFVFKSGISINLHPTFPPRFSNILTQGWKVRVQLFKEWIICFLISLLINWKSLKIPIFRGFLIFTRKNFSEDFILGFCTDKRNFRSIWNLPLLS